MEVQSKLRHARISEKKMQPIAKLVRGLTLQQAIATLHAIPKKGAAMLSKTIESARANAREKQMDVDTLKVKRVSIDKGTIMYRIMTRQRGMASKIRKRTSHLTVVVGD